MGKNLEHFVRDNRNDFDGNEPTDALWDRIEKNLAGAPTKVNLTRLRYRWLAAAAAVILILSAALVYFAMQQRPQTDVLVKHNENKTPEQPIRMNTDIAAIDPDYAKQVAQFTVVIDQKQGELKSLQKDDPVLYQKFSNDINRLDSSYSLLQHQLPVNPNKEELLQAMIYNLQLQIDLLNQQLAVIQKIKSAKIKTL